MHLHHVIPSIDVSTGGPARSVTQLITAMSQIDTGSTFTLHTGSTAHPVMDHFEVPNASVQVYDFGVLGSFKNFSNGLKNTRPQLLHGHGLWQWPVHQMAGLARRYHIPYIISPRGMLEPWSLTQSPVKKQLALRMYQSKDLRNAAVLHATSLMEAQQFRRLEFKNPIAVIPNGVDLDAFPLKKSVPANTPKTLLFLSRLHPKKGIELLIEAWSELESDIKANWQVSIVGNGPEGYIRTLETLITDKTLNNQITIYPPKYGTDKVMAYQNASLFVLPTYSENFGIVVAEALACGTPVITTNGTPWQQLPKEGCGWCIPTGKEALILALKEALIVPENTLANMGIKGSRWVASKYHMRSVATKMLQVYEWILGEVPIPDVLYVEDHIG